MSNQPQQTQPEQIFVNDARGAIHGESRDRERAALLNHLDQFR